MKKLLLLLLFSAFWSTLFAAVGNITALEGKVFVERAGKVTLATSGYALEEKDSIKTEDVSKANIKFTDGSTVSLGKNTEFSIEEYMFGDDANKFSAKLKVTEGIFSATTGIIGKIAPKKFEFGTATSTIGIRGTKWSSRVNPLFEKHYTREGTIIVTAGGESVEVGAGFSTTVEPGKGPSAPEAYDANEVQEITDDTKTEEQGGEEGQDTGAALEQAAEEGKELVERLGEGSKIPPFDLVPPDELPQPDVSEDDADLDFTGYYTKVISNVSTIFGSISGEYTSSSKDSFTASLHESAGYNQNLSENALTWTDSTLSYGKFGLFADDCQYMDWGWWNSSSSATETDPSNAWFVIGYQETPAATLGTLGTSVGYSGTYKGASGTPNNLLSGDMTMNANFVSGAVSYTFTGGYMDGINGTATILGGSNAYEGSFNGGLFKIDGAFYGPNAEATGGTFRYTNVGGIYLLKKD